MFCMSCMLVFGITSFYMDVFFITKCKLWINKICYKAYGFSYCHLLDFENIYYMFVV